MFFQIVMPPNIKYSAEYLARCRRCLRHVISPTTGRCFCGRVADGWDMPDEGVVDRKRITVDDVLADARGHCRACLRGLARYMAVSS